MPSYSDGERLRRLSWCNVKPEMTFMSCLVEELLSEMRLGYTSQIADGRLLKGVGSVSLVELPRIDDVGFDQCWYRQSGGQKFYLRGRLALS